MKVNIKLFIIVIALTIIILRSGLHNERIIMTSEIVSFSLGQPAITFAVTAILIHISRPKCTAYTAMAGSYDYFYLNISCSLSSHHFACV